MQRDVHVFGADAGVTMPTDVDCRIGSMLQLNLSLSGRQNDTAFCRTVLDRFR